ncbi:MAG: halocyanin domain-containing protein [Halobaculum sp.]
MSQTNVSRRDVVRVGAAGIVGGLAGCSGGSGGAATTADSTPTSTAVGASSGSFDGWLSGVENFDSVRDETGSDAVTVDVGVQNGSGAYGFGPAAIRISTGTTVTFEWTGRGASHNVVARDGAFESELTAEDGHTFEHTFESSGTVKYYCQPHRALEMKGVVVVE